MLMTVQWRIKIGHHMDDLLFDELYFAVNLHLDYYVHALVSIFPTIIFVCCAILIRLNWDCNTAFFSGDMRSNNMRGLNNARIHEGRILILSADSLTSHARAACTSRVWVCSLFCLEVATRVHKALNQQPWEKVKDAWQANIYVAFKCKQELDRWTAVPSSSKAVVILRASTTGALRRDARVKIPSVTSYSQRNPGHLLAPQQN